MNRNPQYRESPICRPATMVNVPGRLLVAAISLLVIWAPHTSIPSETFWGICVGVTDGDTISVTRDGRAVKIRLEGIDCPERGQDFSSGARKYTSALVFGKTVEVRKTGTDRYDRVLAVVYADGTNVNLALVQAGMAWHYKTYSSDATLAGQRIPLKGLRSACGRSLHRSRRGIGGAVREAWWHLRRPRETASSTTATGAATSSTNRRAGTNGARTVRECSIRGAVPSRPTIDRVKSVIRKEGSMQKALITSLLVILTSVASISIAGEETAVFGGLNLCGSVEDGIQFLKQRYVDASEKPGVAARKFDYWLMKTELSSGWTEVRMPYFELSVSDELPSPDEIALYAPEFDDSTLVAFGIRWRYKSAGQAKVIFDRLDNILTVVNDSKSQKGIFDHVFESGDKVTTLTWDSASDHVQVLLVCRPVRMKDIEYDTKKAKKSGF